LPSLSKYLYLNINKIHRGGDGGGGGDDDDDNDEEEEDVLFD